MSVPAAPSHPLDRRRSDAPESAIRAAAREFARSNHLARRARELDRAPAFPWPEARALAAQGWLGPRVPASLGGPGRSAFEEAALVEELAFAGGSVFAKLVLQPEFCAALQRASPAVRERWYAPLLRGELWVGNHVTEPNAGSDAGGLETRAERRGDHFVLTGTKSEAAFAADAAAAIVYARTSDAPGPRGVSALLVPQDLPGIRRELFDDLGERWMRRGTVQYEGVKLPLDHLIGEEGRGFSYLLEELTRERTLLALLYLALARASWEETREHVLRRRVFDRPLGSLEGVSFPLAEDRGRLDALRLLAWETLEREEEEERVDGPAAVVKALSNDAALDVLDHAMRFHGGAGYSVRTPHELRWRDARSGTVAHGAREVLLMVAAREFLGRETLPYSPTRASRAEGASRR